MPSNLAYLPSKKRWTWKETDPAAKHGLYAGLAYVVIMLILGLFS